MDHRWKTAPVGNVQRGVANANGDVRAVAENTVTASVIVRALNEYDRVRQETQRLVALRDAVERALTLIPEDIGTNVMPTEHLVEAREILAQAVRESGVPVSEEPSTLVRVTITPHGMGAIFAPTQAIVTRPGDGIQHQLTSFAASIQVDRA